VAEIPQQIERLRDLVDDWSAFTEALHRPLPTDLRWNPFAVTRERFEEMLAHQGLKWTRMPASPDLYRVEGLTGPGLTWAFHMGWYQPQGFTSTLPPIILDPQPGSNVLDLCASPGGKTSQLSAQMMGHGVLVANDINYNRISILAANVERLGVPNVLICSYRGQNFPERFRFDHVLVDAPCTGEGTFRVEAGRYRKDDPDARGFMSRTQLGILGKALRVVRPGGTVLYSTCTYAPEEDEAVVAAVIEESEVGVEVVELPEDLPGSPGIDTWEGRTFPRELSRTRRFWPHHTNSWGFYCALLCRLS
jgi:16S rRNA C967 or C1407 C5-methylase (RsmB/RsmF family)